MQRDSKAPRADREQHAGDKFNRRVLPAYRGGAGAAFPAQHQETKQRDVFPDRELVPAVWTMRRLDHDAGWGRVVGIAQLKCKPAVVLPLPLQPFGEPQDNHVEETAHEQP